MRTSAHADRLPPACGARSYRNVLMATATETTAEFSVVLDVPEDVADRLNHFLDSEPTAAAHSADIPVSLEVKKDGATLTVDGVALPTAVSTLPTVVEAYKSFDNVNFYKTSEVSQMLVTDTPKKICRSSRSLPTDSRHPLPTSGSECGGSAAAPEEVKEVALELEALRSGSIKPDFKVIELEEEKWVAVDDEEAAAAAPAASAAAAAPTGVIKLSLSTGG